MHRDFFFLFLIKYAVQSSPNADCVSLFIFIHKYFTVLELKGKVSTYSLSKDFTESG